MPARELLVLAALCGGVVILALAALPARGTGAIVALLGGIAVVAGAGVVVAIRGRSGRDAPVGPEVAVSVVDLVGVQYTYERLPDQPRRLVHLGEGLEALIGPVNSGRVRERFDTLFELIHPDDVEMQRAAAKRGMDEGRVVETELRGRHDDGRYRWIRSIGRCMPIADGGWRWHVVLIDIDEHKRSERILRLMAERTSTSTGEAFFPALARTISETLDVRHVLVFENVDRAGARARSIAYWSGDGIRENIEIAIAGTPCAGPARGETTLHPSRETHPFEPLPGFDRMDAASFYGCPLRDSNDELIGHVALLDDQPMHAGLDALPALSIFTARAAAELERVRSERALRESTAVIGSVFASMPDGVIVVDADGRVVMCNETVLAFSTRELIGDSMEQLDDGISTFQADGRTPCEVDDWAISRALRGEQVDESLTRVVFHDRDDAEVWFSSSARPIRGAGGDVTGAVTVFRDVSERLRTDRTLRTNEAHLRTIVEHAPEAILMFDVETNRFTDCNANATRLFRSDRADVLSKGPVDYSPAVQPDGRESAVAAQAYIAETLAGRAPVFEWVFRSSAIDPIVCDVRLVLVPDDERPLIRASVTDITARKTAERELRARQEQERLLFRELDHRVRNNLAALIALIDLTRHAASDVPSFAIAIRSRIEAMAHVHDMLSQGRWQSVRFETLLGRLCPPEARGRLVTEGAPIEVPPRQVTAVAMVLHELLLNSVKHGALGATGGVARLDWTTEPADDGACRLELAWSESGGPPITDSSRRGVGTGLIEGLTRAELGGSVETAYPRDGAQHRLVMLLDALGAAEPALTR